MSTKEASLGRTLGTQVGANKQQHNNNSGRHRGDHSSPHRDQPPSYVNSTYTYELFPFDGEGNKYLVDGFGFYVSGSKQSAAPFIHYSELAAAASTQQQQPTTTTSANAADGAAAAVPSSFTSSALGAPLSFGSFGEEVAKEALRQREAEKKATIERRRRTRRSEQQAAAHNASNTAANPQQQQQQQTASLPSAVTTAISDGTPSPSASASPSSSSYCVIPPPYRHIVHLMEEHNAVLSLMDAIHGKVTAAKEAHRDRKRQWEEAALAHNMRLADRMMRFGGGGVGDHDDDDTDAMGGGGGGGALIGGDHLTLLSSPLPHRPFAGAVGASSSSSPTTMNGGGGANWDGNAANANDDESRLERLMDEANSIALAINQYATTLRQYRRLKGFLLKSIRVEIRKYGGSPCPTLRRHLWSFLCGSPFADPARREECAAIYARLVNTPIKSEHSDVIMRDLGRTFPTHALFQDSAAAGQTALRRVLHAYCAVDEELGYCQGMGFIVAVLLLSNSEEESFWILTQMLHGRSFGMRQLYVTGFPLLQKFFVIFRQLLRRLLPKLSQHLDQQCVDVHFYGAQWFLTLFAYQFPIAAVCRIWDLFFSEGWSIIFKVSIAMLEWHQTQLLLLKMENILPLLKSVHEDKVVDEILSRALDVPVTTRDLNEFLLNDGIDDAEA